MLYLAPDINTGETRHRGFLQGLDVEEGDPALAARIDSEGDRELDKSRMSEVLAEHPDINI